MSWVKKVMKEDWEERGKKFAFFRIQKQSPEVEAH
jgi:hypothetical protein